MSVVTIARQLGSGGGELAMRLAESLDWRLLDRALVERIAAELRVEPELVEASDERAESFIERLGVSLSEMYPEILPLPALHSISPELTARAARRIVTAVLHEGPAVIVGHGAQCVLGNEPQAFHVLVHAPLELRIERARERFQIDRAAAAERIERSDQDRYRYVREYYARDWLDATLYHLCIDSGRLGIDASVELVRAAVTRHFRLPAASG